ncbi:hypothetical protein ACIRRA_38355 [Nocardia sp. NPDC101769]|uniref:hypothetical protein n=1 Tax=Nocardia sp. NPDC101769 TaxID=3364333 RepID=UPI003825A915
MTRTLFFSLVSFAPLLIWLLMARTGRQRWLGSLAVAVWGTLFLSVAQRWISLSEQISALALLMVILVAAFMIVLVSRRLSADSPMIPRMNLGKFLASAYCLVVLFYCGGLALVMKGEHAYVPPSSELLPLPHGLTVLSNDDEGCGGNSATICGRAFVIGGPTTQDIAATLVEHLNRKHGWHLNPPTPDGKSDSCRNQGFLLDRNELCASIFQHDGHTDVAFESSADN